MITINLNQAKTNLSQYINQVEAGEVVIICKRNVPVAEIKTVSSLTKTAQAVRPLGLAKGSFEVTSEFFAPLPDDLLSLFNGEEKDA